MRGNERNEPKQQSTSQCTRRHREKERDCPASVSDVVVYRCRDLGLDREEVGVGEGLLDTLVEEVVRRRIGNVSRIGLADTAGKHSDDAIVSVTDDGPGVPGRGESTVLVTV